MSDIAYNQTILSVNQCGQICRIDYNIYYLQKSVKLHILNKMMNLHSTDTLEITLYTVKALILSQVDGCGELVVVETEQLTCSASKNNNEAKVEEAEENMKNNQLISHNLSL